MTNERSRAWLVSQARDLKYSNFVGSACEYLQRIRYGRQIGIGDALIALLPSRDAPKASRIVGRSQIDARARGVRERTIRRATLCSFRPKLDGVGGADS